MASLNKVTLIGFLGKDPEISNHNGTAIAKFSLATTEKWKDQYGNKQERTEWHNVTFFGRTADVVAKYIRKGSQVYVEGSLRTNKYTGKDGIERWSTGINGTVLQMLDRQNGQQDGQYQGGQNNGYQNNGYQQNNPPVQQSQPPSLNEDVPF